MRHGTVTTAVEVNFATLLVQVSSGERPQGSTLPYQIMNPEPNGWNYSRTAQIFLQKNRVLALCLGLIMNVSP